MKNFWLVILAIVLAYSAGCLYAYDKGWLIFTFRTVLMLGAGMIAGRFCSRD